MSAQHLSSDQLQNHVEICGKRLTDAIASINSAESTQHKWLDSLINRTVSDPKFRIQALRFIDVLPSLDDDQVLAEHLQEYFSQVSLPSFADWGLKHSDSPWVTRIASPTVRYTLRGLARKFMGGSQLHHALTSISRLRHQNINFTLDLLGEATISDEESSHYQIQYLDMISSLSEPVNNWAHNSLLDTSHGKNAPRLNVSIKLSSLYSQIRSNAYDKSIQAICVRLRPIVRAAIQYDAFITIDMEQYDLKHIVMGCFRQIIMEHEFKNWPHFGLAIQAYLKDTYDDLTNLIKLAEERQTPFTIRLVRGAYWDYETVIAKQNNWSCPVWEHKNDTDFNYEQCLYLLLSSHEHIHSAIATHNPRSIAYAMALTEHFNLEKDQYEFQMLHGMADDLKQAVVNLNYRLRSYVPYGETLPGMAYLVRRLLENSSGQSLLDSGFNNQQSTLLDFKYAAPEKTCSSVKLKTINNKNFYNTAFKRFTDKLSHDNYLSSINKINNQQLKTFPLIIDGKEIITDNVIRSFNPANHSQIIGTVSSASHQHADMALESANKNFPDWSQTPIQQRADYLRRVASLLNKQRFDFAALETIEAGKNWQEADADVCEAIDFLNFYAQQAEIIGRGKHLNINGEENHISYIPCGVSLVIPPWNFPLAILCGMLCASIVTGNTCILKPSSSTPVVAAKFMQLWQEVGIPKGVINFLPGPGKIVGEYLARKADIHIIAFTGSLQVGSQLLHIGSQIQPGQKHIKKVIAEMGGKNAIIVDNDADLDDAILGTIQSAFGFQGQKCSAASRVIVLQNIYERFTKRLIAAVESINIGNPQDPFNFMGPVIDEAAYKRISLTIDNARQFATVHNYDIRPEPDTGYFIKPCIFTDVDPDSPLAQEEIFGPVLAVLKAKDFENAIELANNTRFALTGGVYSRQPSHLDYARKHFKVGNLFFNRHITGALVNRQPFGGFNMSGAGSKTGGSDYLFQFMHAQCVTENTLRRGFAPDPD